MDLLSRKGEPFNFELHSGDLAHTVIVGPTGQGMTVMAEFVAAIDRQIVVEDCPELPAMQKTSAG